MKYLVPKVLRYAADTGDVIAILKLRNIEKGGNHFKVKIDKILWQKDDWYQFTISQYESDVYNENEFLSIEELIKFIFEKKLIGKWYL